MASTVSPRSNLRLNNTPEVAGKVGKIFGGLESGPLEIFPVKFGMMTNKSTFSRQIKDEAMGKPFKIRGYNSDEKYDKYEITSTKATSSAKSFPHPRLNFYASCETVTRPDI